MGIRATLSERWAGISEPFLIGPRGSVAAGDILDREFPALREVEAGQVVSVVGDFDSLSIALLVELIERGAIVVPLTIDTRERHSLFFEAALVDWVFHNGRLIRRPHSMSHPLIDELRSRGNPGLVLFTSGTTGDPKAILHDMNVFLERFLTPRPSLRTLGFLVFDHIGGLNTLFHTLFNTGSVVTSDDRSPRGIIEACLGHRIELLPTTPTFLRMLLLSGMVEDLRGSALKVVTYGTELMDAQTLKELARKLPEVDLRQTYGLSELGILRIKSRAKDSLFMKVGGEGVETRVVDGVLEIRASGRMLGYLNAENPFDDEGWYCTGDMVEQDGDFLRVTGRRSNVINVGGLKFQGAEVEEVAIRFPGVAAVSAIAQPNPLTGQHVELEVQFQDHQPLNGELKKFLAERLPPHMLPRRVRIVDGLVNHRFKKAK